MHDRIAEVPHRFPDIDLCLIHLGGTRVAGILLTMDAEQGVRFLQIVKPKTAVPIHFNDYTVFKSPLDDFRAAAAKAGLESEIRYVAHGETITLPSPRRPAPS
jgi:L-ascorbate metabolism protein UlaG (beta-lactamase superfamily)